MNTKLSKCFFWGGIVAAIIFILNGVHYLFGGLTALAASPHGHGPRGLDPHGGFGPRHMMEHYHNGFSWIWLTFLFTRTFYRILELFVRRFVIRHI